MNHPVTWIVGNKLDVPRLGYSDEHGVAGPPSGLGNPAAFGSCRVEGVPVQMHRMVVHAEIYEADANTVPEPNDKRSRCRTGFSIEDQPVELHVHRVGHGVVRQDRIFLQMDQEVLIAMRLVGLFGMHNEGTEHPGHLLHRHVRVVKVSACLMNIELIDKAPAWFHWLLADAGLTVVLNGVFKSVPVDGSRLR